MQALEPCTRVRDINWTNPDLNRAGVLPVYNLNGNVLVGVGVNTYTTNVSPLGGSFEKDDIDLLSTAVREYNEEVGDNYPHLKVGDLINRYAIQDEFTAQIFVEVEPTRFFKKTEEIYDLLWVTPLQLRIMTRLNKFAFEGVNLFKFNHRFVTLFETIASAIEGGCAFATVDSDEPMEQYKKRYEEPVLRLFTGLEAVEAHRLEFIGHSPIVFTPQWIYIMSKMKTAVRLPATDETLHRLADLPVKYYSAFPQDVNIVKNAKKILGRRVNYIIRSENKTYNKFFKDTVEAARKAGDIMGEINAIQAYEERNYNQDKEDGVNFVHPRGALLTALSYINLEVASTGEGFFIPQARQQVRDLLRKKTRYQNVDRIFEVLVETGLLVVSEEDYFLIPV